MVKTIKTCILCLIFFSPEKIVEWKSLLYTFVRLCVQRMYYASIFLRWLKFKIIQIINTYTYAVFLSFFLGTCTKIKISK